MVRGALLVEKATEICTSVVRLQRVGTRACKSCYILQPKLKKNQEVTGLGEVEGVVQPEGGGEGEVEVYQTRVDIKGKEEEQEEGKMEVGGEVQEEVGGGSPGEPEITDRERVRLRREERTQQTQALIQRVPEERLRELVSQLTEREPGLVFDLCQNAMESTQPDPQPERDNQKHRPPWCICSHCVDMPTELENKCCNCLPQNCISQRLEMETLVLDPQVLAIGNNYHRDMLGMYGRNEEDYNKSLRHSAYRNFTLWRHGRLGQGQRRVIPSCVVKRIRAAFPSATNTYTGFVQGRFA